MAGKWKAYDLGCMCESPETHWKRTVMGLEGPQWCSVRIPRDMAGHLVKAFANQCVPGDDVDRGLPDDCEATAEFEDMIRCGARIAQSGFANLTRFWQYGREDSLEVELLAQPEAREALERLSASGSLRVTDVCLPSAATGSIPDTLAFPRNSPDPKVSPVGDQNVIVAVIDDGIAVANHRFRMSDAETRIEYFLDMNHPPSCNNGHGDAGSMVDVAGRCWSKEELNDLLRKHPRDEEAVYRAMGMIDPNSDGRQPLKFRNTHGTHVLDLAAGYDYATEGEAAQKRPIIAVQLPSDIVADRSDSMMACALKRALHWVADAAIELSERAIESGERDTYLPIVLNFSFGLFAGPHDGFGDVEKRIGEFVRDYRNLPNNPRCEVVLAAGNGLQARAIAHLKVDSSKRLEPPPWRIQPEDRSSNFMQIWLPHDKKTRAKEGKQQVSVALVPPRCGPGKVVYSKLGKRLDWEIDGTTYARIYHQRIWRSDGGSRERITIVTRPTVAESGDEPTCPAGLWQVEIKNECLAKKSQIDLRIQRDDPVTFQRRKGRQSYFDDPDYVRFEPDTGRLRNKEWLDEGPVSREETLSAYATGQDSVVAAGYRRSDGAPALYSSSGPATSGRQGPTLAAVSEESPAHPGVIAAGTYSGSVAIMNGTSVAAPMVTRSLADTIAAGGTLKTLLKAVGDRDVAGERGIVGPHGPYCPARVARHGVGRLVTEQIPAFRTRIDG